MTGTTEKTLTVTVNMPRPLEQDARALLLRVETSTIETEESYTAFRDALAQIKSHRDAHQNERIDIKKPVTALGRTIDEQFWAAISILDSAIHVGQQKLAACDGLKQSRSRRSVCGRSTGPWRRGKVRDGGGNGGRSDSPCEGCCGRPVHGAGAGSGRAREFAAT
jgi:hypothetical protein